MGIKVLSWSGVLALALSVASPPAFSDTISGSGGAGFQSWAVTNLNENGSPYWDNTSMDGVNRNVGFYLAGAPGALPYWGNAFDSGNDTGGTADPSFFFQTTAPSSMAVLQLEVAGRSNVNEFGWYDLPTPASPPTLHALFLGPDVALTTNTFSPGTQYGFYVRSDSTDLYFTQSSLNSGGDTGHQHFAIFRESSVTGAESYWIGVEDSSENGLGGNENHVGDYNDMIIHISALSVPEPSTAMLVLSGSLLMIGLIRRRSTRLSGPVLPS
jgi:hypothetical protein